MKKNLRIVSAAAAALLAVAPIAASSVTANAATTITANAATTITANVTNGTSTSQGKTYNVNFTLSVEGANSIKAGSQPSSLKVNLLSNIGTPKINGKVQAFEVTNNTVSSTPAATLEAGKTYVVKADNVTVNGLSANTAYSVDNTSAVNSDQYGALTNNGKGYTVQSTQFQVPDTNKKGVPYFVNKNNKVIYNGEAISPSQNSVNAIVKAITDAGYEAKIDSSSSNKGDVATVKQPNIEEDVKASLKAADITVDDNGNFNTPLSAFTVNLTATASNGKTATLPITVNAPAPSYTGYPQISYNGTAVKGLETSSVANIDLSNADKSSFGSIKLNGSVDSSAIEKAFTAQVSKDNPSTLSVSVDSSKVNTKVAGTYPVTVSAKNPAGLTSSVVFNVTVGDPNAKYETVAALGENTPIYNINGNTVTKTNNTVANGTKVAVYDTVTKDGVSYTRINSADSTEFVETSAVNGTYANPTKRTIMHNAYYYEKVGDNSVKRVGTDRITRYNSVTTYGDKVSINNISYYRTEKGLINADNIDGTSRTLKHNAYVYATSKKRANKQVLKKGTKVTTYGGAYPFKNGKKYYKIGNDTKKTYVKVANFE